MDAEHLLYVVDYGKGIEGFHPVAEVVALSGAFHSVRRRHAFPSASRVVEVKGGGDEHEDQKDTEHAPACVFTQLNLVF